MRLITNIQFNNNCWAFTCARAGHELTSAARYAGPLYRKCNPIAGEENHRYMLVGDGNYYVGQQNEPIFEIACAILLLNETGEHYLLQRQDLRKDFVETP